MIGPPGGKGRPRGVRRGSSRLRKSILSGNYAHRKLDTFVSRAGFHCLVRDEMFSSRFRLKFRIALGYPSAGSAGESISRAKNRDDAPLSSDHPIGIGRFGMKTARAGEAIPLKLETQLRFEQLIADLTARFVNVAPEDLDAEVEDGLRQIVEALDLD